MRSIEEKEKEKNRLRALKKSLPEESFFGENNWLIIDAQMDVIDGLIDEDEVYEREEEFGTTGVNTVMEAFDWLSGGIDSLVSDDDILDEVEDTKEETAAAVKRIIGEIEARRAKREAQRNKKSPLEHFRTRWMRWLGQKCRYDKPNWTSLLYSNWSAWVSYVSHKHNTPYSPLGMTMDVEVIRDFYKKAIDVADMDDLSKLDNLYCEDKMRRTIYKHRG